MALQQAKEKYQQQVGRKMELEDSIEQLIRKVRQDKRRLKRLEKAHAIIKQVGLETQQQLKVHISDITSLALDSVFDEPYKLVLDFVERRDKTECDILFEKDGSYIDPLTAAGGGVVDLAAFALRIASWAMRTPRTRNTIILDEPFKHLSKDLHDRASQMIQNLSKQLGIQFIIVTHEPALSQFADKVFEVKQRKGVSKIITIK